MLFAAERLAIGGPGVTVDELTQDNSKYRFRYGGLRLLIQSPNQYLLVPAGWVRGADNAFLLPADDTVRIDIRAR